MPSNFKVGIVSIALVIAKVFSIRYAVLNEEIRPSASNMVVSNYKLRSNLEDIKNLKISLNAVRRFSDALLGEWQSKMEADL